MFCFTNRYMCKFQPNFLEFFITLNKKAHCCAYVYFKVSRVISRGGSYAAVPIS